MCSKAAAAKVARSGTCVSLLNVVVEPLSSLEERMGADVAAKLRFDTPGANAPPVAEKYLQVTRGGLGDAVEPMALHLFGWTQQAADELAKTILWPWKARGKVGSMSRGWERVRCAGTCTMM